MSDINFKNDIRVSHELNHLRGAFTKLELDFTYSFLSMIKKEDRELTNYSLSLAELEKKMERRLQLKDVEYLFDTLMKKEFRINNENILEVYTFFTYLGFDKINKTLTVDFNTRLKPHLLDLQYFALGNLKYIFALKSEYAKRIYMLISQWKGSIKSRPYTIDELRDILEVPDNYLYGDFKRRVIKIAEKQLLEYSDYYFKYVEKKEGTKVVSITFTVHENINLKRAEQGKAAELIIPEGALFNSELDEKLKVYIGKQLYYNGYDWQIISIAKNKKNYIVYMHEIDDQSYTKTFEISETQLNMAK